MTVMRLLSLLAILLWLAASVSAQPLLNRPMASDLMLHTGAQQTFLCYCPFDVPTGIIDNDGCESPGEYAKLGHIVPSSLIRKWLRPPNNNLPASVEDDIVSMASRDPVNLALFSDAVLNLYDKSTQKVAGLDTPRGQFQSCRLDIRNGLTRMTDGRLAVFARTALYLADTYGIALPEGERKQFEDIHMALWPTLQERRRNERLRAWNGSWNHWVAAPDGYKPVQQREVEGLMDHLWENRIRGSWQWNQ